MDRKRTSTRLSDTPRQRPTTDAIRILEKDHRKVEQLLERYRTRRDAAAKRTLIRAIAAELTRHMTAEEQELYPLLRDGIPDGHSLIRDAVREHEQARGLLAELAHGETDGFDMDAKVATLRQSIAHHVRDEEQDVFPRMRESLDAARIRGIGARLLRAKKAAPVRPARSAARKSPGASMRGVVAAAADRVTSFLAAPASAPRGPKSRPKRTARTETAPRRARATTAPRRSRAAGGAAKHK